MAEEIIDIEVDTEDPKDPLGILGKKNGDPLGILKKKDRPLSVTQLPSGSSSGKLPSSYGQNPSIEKTRLSELYGKLKRDEQEDLLNKEIEPGVLTRGFQASDARVGGDEFGSTNAAKTSAGIYNTLVSSVARLAGGTAKLGQDLSNVYVPIQKALVPDFRKPVTEFIEKARSPVSTKEDERKAGSFDVTDGVSMNDVKGLLFNAPSTLLDMVGGATTGGRHIYNTSSK